jgi:hypothetical protein
MKGFAVSTAVSGYFAIVGLSNATTLSIAVLREKINSIVFPDTNTILLNELSSKFSLRR